MALQRGDDTDFLGGSSERKEVIEVGNCTRWSELLTDLLESIFERVGAVDYFMCACVCKSWRSGANSFKQRFMASQGPLVFLPSPHADAGDHGYFYNMFDERLYRAALPHLAGNRCLGFTCGYLVLAGLTEDIANIWLVNPFTRHELEFPRPPREYSCVILASLASSDGEFLVIAFSRLFPCIQFHWSGDVDWIAYDSRTSCGMNVDVAVFKGKVYALTSLGAIGILNLNSRSPTVTFLHVEIVSISQFSHHLVASHEELYMIYFYPNIIFVATKIYKLDFERMKWVKVILEDQVLFLGALKCPGLSFPTPSRMQRRFLSQHVCFLGADPTVNFVNDYYMALWVIGMLYTRVPAAPQNWTPRDFSTHSALWYFPHLSSSVDSVNED